MDDVGGWDVSLASCSALCYRFSQLCTITLVLSSGSTSTCSAFNLSSPYYAHSCAQAIPRRKRGTPIEGVVLLFRIIATYLSRPKPVATTLIWRSRRNLDKLLMIGKMNYPELSLQLVEQWSVDRITRFLRTCLLGWSLGSTL